MSSPLCHLCDLFKNLNFSKHVVTLQISVFLCKDYRLCFLLDLFSIFFVLFKCNWVQILFFQGSLLIRVHKEMRLYSVNC